MENGTITVVEYTISYFYLLGFFASIGFVYHIIRTKEYKDTLLASVIIGCILGLVFNSTNLLEWTERILAAIIVILIGGFVAVGLKKVIKVK